jgi:hypothetical protein
MNPPPAPPRRGASFECSSCRFPLLGGVKGWVHGQKFWIDIARTLLGSAIELILSTDANSQCHEQSSTSDSRAEGRPKSAQMKAISRALSQKEADSPRLTKRQMTEIKRRIADSDDPTRYVIISAFTKRFCLYYRVSDGDFIMNEIPLFKRRAEAVAVARVIERRRRRRVRRSLQVIAVRKTKKGIRILNTIQSPWGEERSLEALFGNYEGEVIRPPK